ncbi:MAG: hypothetical protein H6721_16125 [Sandaracinus sp.]|nr:hypothetical protein [Sandaracinus sp.]MCB9619356.1 hypothetical protein [Sandaracinus sp.]MCB9633645.1 hypothetical protein [Sandaracinus sp.]
MPSANRIFFPGNPWREGHAVEHLQWTGRIEADGLYFDLDLRSANYDAERRLETDDLDLDSWESPLVWGNYHRCSLSSTKWGQDEGIFVADAKAPLDWSTLDQRIFEVDMRTSLDDDEEHAFHIYLLGHDTVLRHQIHFSEPSRGTYRLRWKAHVALTYAGDDELKHRLEVDAEVAFEGFRPAPGLSNPQAHLERFTGGKTGYAKRAGVYVPK